MGGNTSIGVIHISVLFQIYITYRKGRMENVSVISAQMTQSNVYENKSNVHVSVKMAKKKKWKKMEVVTVHVNVQTVKRVLWT